MPLVVLLGLLSNLVYLLLLPGLNLCPLIAMDYDHKGFGTASPPPAPHSTHCPFFRKALTPPFSL